MAPIDPSKLAPGRIEQTEIGTLFIGESATRLYQLRTIIMALKLEMKGMRLSRGISALAKAKQLTGLTANNRPAQITALESLCTQLEGNINQAEENPRQKGDDDGVEYADPRDHRDGLE